MNGYRKSTVQIIRKYIHQRHRPEYVTPERVARKASHRINAKPLDIFHKTKKIQLPKLRKNGYEGFTLPVKNPRNDGYAKLSHNCLVVFL